MTAALMTRPATEAEREGLIARKAAAAAMHQRFGFTPHAIELLKPIGPR
jgi:hypothetical protein